MLGKRHPPASPIHPDPLLDFDPELSSPVAFQNLPGNSIRIAVLHCQGAMGPPTMGRRSWKRMCTRYHCAPQMVVWRAGYCSEAHLHKIRVDQYWSWDSTGVRPVGISDTLRRIMGKAILKVLGPEIQTVAGSSQLCAHQPLIGLQSGISCRKRYLERSISLSVEGVLMVDAETLLTPSTMQWCSAAYRSWHLPSQQ